MAGESPGGTAEPDDPPGRSVEEPPVADRPVEDPPVEDLLAGLLSRVKDVVDERARLQLLLDAVVALTSDLTLDGVLERIVEVASTLVDARYAALGVLSEGPGPRLRTFVHHGLDEARVAEIGDLPTGHGILGLIIDRPRPLRLADLASHSASSGFPEHHPPMHSFLGVPVRAREKVFGNLYLTEKADGEDFTARDEEIVVALASAAGAAIENARLHEEAQRREEWLTATADITARLVSSDATSGALQTVADRARAIGRADAGWIVVGGDGHPLRVEAVSGVPGGLTEDLRAAPLEHSLAHEVVSSGRALTSEDLATDPRAFDVSTLEGWPRLGPAVVVPLRTSSGVLGVLALAWTPERVEAYHDLDAALPARFAEQAALAIEVARARRDSERLAVLEDRDRIARDLHDLVIQRLFAVCLGLQSTGRRVADEAVAGRLDDAVDELDATIKDIRRTIFSLGSLGTSDDIQSEVTRLVQRAGSTLKFHPTLRMEGPVRTMVSAEVAPDLLAVLGEALSNASRHAEAGAIDVSLAAADGQVVLEVRDDGRGLPPTLLESGLGTMRDRAHRHGGSLLVESAPGQGTAVVWSVPTEP